MPGLSGHEVGRRIKANPDRRKIPAIFVAAMDDTEYERGALTDQEVDRPG